MTKTAVILAAGKSQKLDPFHTHKPLLLVHGKPLIVHAIEHLEKAGVEKIFIITGSSRSEIERIVGERRTRGILYEFIKGTDEENITETFKTVAGTLGDECIIVSSDLIFENNPFLYLQQEGDGSFLVDPYREHNKFSGAAIGIIDRFPYGPAFSPLSPGHTEQLTGVYWFSKEGLSRFLHILRSIPQPNETHFSYALSNAMEKMSITMSPLPKMTWFDINTPETLLRAEMFLRSKSRSKRPTKVSTESLVSAETPFFFSHKKQMTTPVIIEPGLLKHFTDYHLMPPERTASHHILITDSTVDALFGASVEEQMKNAGYMLTKIVVPVGEGTKSMRMYGELAEKIIAMGVDEQSIIFALGGGVVANISGFLASTIYRGIGLIHIPTTVMNMIDVSVSLKQGINDHKGKNLVGSYYQPLLVLIDPSLSIPDWLVRDGISEAIKHAVCQDTGFFSSLEKYEGAFDDVAFRTALAKKTISLKTELMAEDMFEHHRAMVLQYGHEVGHAVEFLSGFSLTHGQGIAIGMRVSAEAAHLMGIAADDVVSAHKKIFKKYGLPYVVPKTLTAGAIVEALKFNKKNRGTDIRMVLPEKIGKVWKINKEYGIPCPTVIIENALMRSYSE